MSQQTAVTNQRVGQGPRIGYEGTVSNPYTSNRSISQVSPNKERAAGGTQVPGSDARGLQISASNNTFKTLDRDESRLSSFQQNQSVLQQSSAKKRNLRYDYHSSSAIELSGLALNVRRETSPELSRSPVIREEVEESQMECVQ